jgi:membrane protease YdiL (CAAX protease family)
VVAQNQMDDVWGYQTESTNADASDVALPLLSLVLPGAGQWARGQWKSGLAYSGLSIGAATYALQAKRDFGLGEIEPRELTGDNVAARKHLLGLQTTQALGGLSLYHSFRSAVWQRQKFGEYQFLGSGETPVDLLKAPFRFDMLGRSTTYVPLTLAAAASWYIAKHDIEGYTKRKLSKEDPWFASAFSLNAGVHEEAMFRGWLMPVLYNSGMNGAWTNVTQSSLFALAHLGSNPLPISQFFMGLHLGQVTIRNRWQLSEAIFVHTWWDIMIFIATYHNKKVDENLSKPASLHLPPLQIYF